MDTPSSPLKIKAILKRKRISTDLSLCIICQTPREEALLAATDDGKVSLWNAACTRKDMVYKTIIGEFDNLFLESTCPIFYHKNCIGPYRSPSNLKHLNGEAFLTEEKNEKRKEALSSEIDWGLCIICQKQYRKKVKQTHLLSTETKAQYLVQAAMDNDDSMALNNVTADELIKNKAVYHSSCMQALRFASEKARKTKTNEKTDHDRAFQDFAESISEDLFDNNRIFTMAELLPIYKAYLPSEKALAYTTWKLKAKLESWFGEKIRFYDFGGNESSIVFSSEVTVGDAVKAASALKEDVAHHRVLLETKPLVDNEQMVLHKAVAILRREMSTVDEMKEYPGPEGTSGSGSDAYVPPILLQFIEDLLDLTGSKADSKARRAKAIAECIIYSGKGVLPPLQLGIGITLHHDYGSKMLIELLNAFGFCASYSEVRQFMTSAAMSEVSKIRNGVYHPSGIIKRADGGNLIQEGADNIDINTNTIDGKNTFHSLARVCFQQRNGESKVPEHTCIPISKEVKLTITPEARKYMKPLDFPKPKIRPVPPRYNKAAERLTDIMKGSFSVNDFVWVILRSFAREPLQRNLDVTIKNDQVIPFWSDFNRSFSPINEYSTEVSYKPIIDATPTEMDTLYTSMLNCSATAKALGQEYSIQTMDQQLYAIGQQVKWGCPEKFMSHFNRLGGFHTICCFISSIGKLWGDGGLKDLLKDSNVYAACTVDSMLEGKQYHRSVRALTLVYECLLSTLVKSYLEVSEDVGVLTPQGEAEICVIYGSLSQPDGISNDDVQRILNFDPADIANDFLLFLENGCKKSPTFKYWFMLLEAIQILLECIRAERSGNWNAHLASQCNMLPYLFCTNRQNYSRWLPVYLLEMLVDIPEDMNERFEGGEFTFRFRPNTSFNGIWTDMAVEKTVIRDSKSDGGVVGLTRKKEALLRWYLSRHIMGRYSHVVKTRAGLVSTDGDPVVKVSNSSLQKDEDDVNTLMNHITTHMSNPFDTDTDDVLINISTGLQASDEVKASLTGAVDTGKKRMESFVRSNLEIGQHGNFYSPISRVNIKTFQSMIIPTPVSASGKKGSKKVTVSPETIFRRGLALAEFRTDITIDSLMSHPIGALPLSLFNEDGSPRKTTKSDLGSYLEARAAVVSEIVEEELPKRVVYIRDGMAVLHAVSLDTCQTFDDLVQKYMKGVVSCMAVADTVIDVFDRYDIEHSIVFRTTSSF